MSSRLPLIVLDEIVLPGPMSTEVLLDPDERAFLERWLGHGDAPLSRDIVVAIAFRAPDESATSRSDGLLEAVVVGDGKLEPATPADPEFRLALGSPTRARLVTFEAEAGGGMSEIAPWSYERDEPGPGGDANISAGEISELLRRFYRLLLVSRSQSRLAPPQHLEDLVFELEEAESDTQRLLLMADQLFERRDVRAGIVTADTLVEVRDIVSDALELMEQGLPRTKGAIRQSLASYVACRGAGDVARSALVLRTLAPLLEPSPQLLEQLDSALEAIQASQIRLDRLVTRLLKPRRGERIDAS